MDELLQFILHSSYLYNSSAYSYDISIKNKKNNSVLFWLNLKIAVITWHDTVPFENPSHFLGRVGVLYSLFMLCYHRGRNDEVLQWAGLTSLSHLLTRRRISVFGHVARLDDDTPANVAFQLHVMGLLQLRYEHDSSTIRLRFDYDSATTRYNTLRGFSFARIRDRIRESMVGVSCMLIDSSMHTAFTLYLYRPTLHRVCEYARNCLYKSN